MAVSSIKIALGLALSSCVLLGVASTACSAGPATPSTPTTPDYPTKPITMIVPYAAGGGADISARVLAKYLSPKWGQDIAVTNLAGASGAIGTSKMIGSAPDGYTMMMDAMSSSSMLAAAWEKLPFPKWDDRTFIARITVDPIFFMVNKDSPWKTVKEMVDDVKSKKVTLKWGTSGVGASSFFSGVMLFDATGIPYADVAQVQLEGGAAIVTNLAGGHIDMGSLQLSEMFGPTQSGAIRPLAVVSPERLKQFPNVPTIKEAGYDFFITGWQGVSGPAKLPDYVVKKWEKVTEEMANDPEYKKKVEALHSDVQYLNSKDCTKFVYEEAKYYTELAKRIGLRK